MHRIALIAAVLFAFGCAPIVKGVKAVQPNVTTDSPNLWVALDTDDTALNGIYRCVDAPPAQPTCKKATLVR